MKLDLTKEDLASLVRGTSPYYTSHDHPLVSKCGEYHGGFSDRWTWNFGFENHLTEEELWELYTTIRDGWAEYRKQR